MVMLESLSCDADHHADIFFLFRKSPRPEVFKVIKNVQGTKIIWATLSAYYEKWFKDNLLAGNFTL
jgi:hypothetical protein